MRPYWDDRTKGRIRRWWAAQVSDAEMGRRLGVGPRQICTWRKKLGLPNLAARRVVQAPPPSPTGELCTKCGGFMVRTGSCMTCQGCGNSSGGCG